MYIDLVPNRRSKPAILLRESIREGKRIKKRTIANLSALTLEQAEAIRLVLKGEQLAASGGLKCIRSLPHGHVEAVRVALRRLGFDRLIDGKASRERDLAVDGRLAAFGKRRCQFQPNRRRHRNAARTCGGDADRARLYGSAINPKQMDRFRDRFTLAGAKDDSRDAEVMASALRTDPHCLRLLAALDPTVIELLEWSRIASELGTERNRLTNRLREQLWRYCAQVARSAIAQQKNFPQCWSSKAILALRGCSTCGNWRPHPARPRASARGR